MDANSNCCGGATTVCDSTIAELPRYYPRQLITPDDLTLEQNYFRDRMRRHNRLLHGWGVVCGALVCPVTTQDANGVTSFSPCQVQVQPGYVLGPYGDEIILDCPRTVDLRTSGVSGVTGEPCIDAPDPWCTQVFTPPSTTNTLYIAVKYTQSMARPVRVQPVGCGCDDTACEYSRWKDGYEIGVLQACPAGNACDPRVTPTRNIELGGSIPTCPDCTCGPWVCLAQVTLSPDGSGGIQQIDNIACRRQVVSFAKLWWQSADVLSTPAVTYTPDPLSAGSGATVTVTGNNLDLVPAHYLFSPAAGVTVQSPEWTPSPTPGTSVDLTVTVANAGNYTLTVITSDCSTYIFPITVVGQSAPMTAVQARVSSARPTPKPAAKKTNGRSGKA